MADLGFLDDIPDAKPTGSALNPSGPAGTATLTPEPTVPDVMEPDFLKEIPDAKLPTEDNYWRTAQTKPDEAAKVIGLSKRLAAPEQYVENHLSDLEAVQNAPDAGYWSDLAKKAPKTHAFLSDPQNMAVAKDDIENMKTQEATVDSYSLGDSLWRSLNSGLSRMNATATRVPALTYDLGALPQNYFFKTIGRPDLQVRAPEWVQFKSSGAWWDDQAKQWAPPELDKSTVEQLQKGDYAGAAKTLAAQVVANAPTQAMMLAGAAAGYGAPALVAMGVQQASDVAYQNRTKGADPTSSTVDAITQGTIEAGFESLGTLGLFHTWENAIAKSVGKASGRKVMMDMAKTLAHTFLGEANEEFLTQIAQDASSYATGTNPDAMRGTFTRALDAGLIGGFSGAGMTAPSASMSGIYRGLEVRRAEVAKNTYLALGEGEVASKARARLPEARKAWVDQTTKGTPVSHIYADLDKFDTYFQDKKIDPAQMAEELGIGEQYKQAHETGADLKIPHADWFDKIAQTEHFAGLADDIKFHAEDLTNRQAQETKARINEEMKVEAEKAQVDLTEAVKDPVWKQAHDAAYHEIYDQRIAAGAKPALAKAEASVWAANAITEARAKNLPAESLTYKGRKLINIVANQTPAQVAQLAFKTPEMQELIAKRTELEAQPASNEEATQQLVALNLQIDTLAKSGSQTVSQVPSDVASQLPPEAIHQIVSTMDHGPFQEWFAGSKVVDENGAPKVVYHGSPKTGHEVFKGPAWFTSQAFMASEYASVPHFGSRGVNNQGVYPVFLSLKNPFITTSANDLSEGAYSEARVSALKAQGYDGMMDAEMTQIIPFDQSQIKSVFNQGTFSPSDPNILYQDAPPAEGFHLPSELPVIKELLKTGPPHAVFSYNWKFSPTSPITAYFKLFGDPQQIIEKTSLPGQPSGNGWASDVSLNTLMRAGIPVVGRMDTKAAAEAPAVGQTFYQSPTDEEHYAPTFFSQLEKTIETKMSNKAQPNEVKGIIAQGLKAEEVEWSGINEWLDEQKGTLTKQAVMDFVRANAMKVEELLHRPAAERVRGDRSDFQDSEEVEEKAQALQDAATESAMEDWYWEPPDGYGAEELEVEQPADVGQKDLFGKVIEEKPAKHVARVNGTLVLFNDLNQWDRKHATEETIVDPNDGEEVEGVAVFEDEDNARDAFQSAAEEDENSARDDAYREFQRDHPLEDYLQEARDELGEPGPDDEVDEDDEDTEPVAIGDAETPSGPTKWASYQVPGATEYGELLFTLPQRYRSYVESSEQLPSGGWRVLIGDGKYKDFPQTTDMKVAEGLAMSSMKFAKPIGDFNYDVHWREDRVFAHVRFNVRTDEQGNRYLFIEELQSDWHQQAREARVEAIDAINDDKKLTPEEKTAKIEALGKDYGYKRKLTDEEISQIDALDLKRGKLRAKQQALMDNHRAVNPQLDHDYEKISDQISAIKAPQEHVSDAPFKKSWHEYSMKRMIRWAVDHGFSKLAWTGGRIQVDRWSNDLRQNVDQIDWKVIKGANLSVDITALKEGDKRFGHAVPVQGRADISGHKAGLEQIVGSKLAKEIRAALVAGTEEGSFKGGDLVIGGEGFAGFYDKILPEFVGRYTKKWGGKVTQGALDEPSGLYEVLDDQGEPIRTFRAPNLEAAQKSHVKTVEDGINGEGTNIREITPPAINKPIHILEITPEMKKSVQQLGQTLFQSERVKPDSQLFQDEGSKPNSERGFTTFAQDHDIWVSIMDSADESTFVHESAHIMLQRRFEYVLTGKADAKYMADWKLMADWMGVKAGQTQLTREQHEQWARGFESYLRDGHAPSEALRTIFAQFRRWLLKIYPDANRLGVNVTPAVRGVMDRMLASEEEIAYAESSMGANIEAEIAGLAPEVQAKLRDLAEQAHDTAVSRLLAKQMKEVGAEHKEMLAGEKVKAQKQAEAEVAELPEQVALEGFKRANFQSKDGRKVSAAYLDIETPMSEADKTSFDMLAEMYGFEDGTQMAHALIDAPSAKAEVTVRVNKHMSEFADLRNTDQIRDEAMTALHNDKRAELLAAEAAAFQSLVDDAQGRAVLKLRRRAEGKVEKEEITRRAEQIIRALSAGQAGQYMPYFTAERNAALKSAKAQLNKNYEKAAQFKRQQLLNHALAVESLRARRKVERWEGYLHDTQKKEMSLFRKEEHYAQVASLLERFGFPRKDYNPNIPKEPLYKWAARMEEETGMVSLPDWLLNDEVLAKPYDELSVEMLNELVDALRNIQRVANAENTTVSIEKGKDVGLLVMELAGIAEVNTPERKKYKPQVEPVFMERQRTLAAKYLFNLKKVSTIMSQLDGGKEFGRWSNIFWQPVYEAANVESRMMQSLNKGLQDLWGVYSMAERKAMSKPVFNEDLGIKFSKMRWIMLALNIGNDGNREKVFTSRPVGMPENLPWHQETVMELLEKNLDQRDWDFVQRTWNFINQLWPEAAAMHKDLTGFAPGKVEARGFDVKLPTGIVRHMEGGYFPLKRDPKSSGKAQLQETLDSPLYTEQNPGWKAMTRTGHLKERVKVKYPVALEITLINRHLRDVVHDIAFRPTIIDLRRLMNNEVMQETLRRNLGPSGFANMREWVASVAGPSVNDRVATEEWQTMVAAMRKRTSVAILFLKPAIFLQNFANPFLFHNAVEGFTARDALHGFFVRGVMDYLPKVIFNWKAAAEQRQFVYDNSAFMADKKDSPDFSLAEAHNKIFGKDSPLHHFATALMGGTDEITNIPMWMEAFSKEMAISGDKKKAVRFADKLIDSATGSGRKYDQAGISRGDELTKSMAMFYSFWNTEYNRWSKETGRVVSPAALPRYLGFVASRLIFFDLLSMILSGKWPEDEDNTLAWWLKHFISYPMSFFPGLREIGSVALDHSLGLQSYGYRPSPILSVVDTGLKSVKQTAQFVRGEGDLADVAEAVSHTAAFAYPYPDQLNNIFWNAYDMTVNGMEPQIGDIYRRRPKDQR